MINNSYLHVSREKGKQNILVHSRNGLRKYTNSTVCLPGNIRKGERTSLTYLTLLFLAERVNQTRHRRAPDTRGRTKLQLVVRSLGGIYYVLYTDRHRHSSIDNIDTDRRTDGPRGRVGRWREEVGAASPLQLIRQERKRTEMASGNLFFICLLIRAGSVIHARRQKSLVSH